MSLSMDKAVRGATKPKRAAPKNKYLEVLIPAASRDDTLETMFMSLDYRLKEPSWTVVFKSLIVVHTLMRHCEGNRVLSHLVKFPGLLNVSGFKNKSGLYGAEQNKNIHSYAMYLEEKVDVYRELKIDFAKNEGGGRLKKLTVDKGLLRHVNILQRQLETLLNCKFYLDEINNEITLRAFCLLIEDSMALFTSVNEGVIGVLDQYVDMSKIDAKDALQIYKKFVKQTEKVVEYLGAAKRIQGLGVKIPDLKHAPTSLTAFLEDYVNDPEFEINRRQHKLAKEERAKAQRASKISPASVKPVDKKPSDSKPKIVESLPTSSDKVPTKENDFFASIEQEHTVIFNNQYTATDTLTTNSPRYNPFLVMQNQEVQSPMQQNFDQQKLQPTSPIRDTNPFRSSVYVQDPAPISQSVVSYQNPFLQSLPSATNSSNPSNPFVSMNSGAQFQSQLLQQNIQPSITPEPTTIDNNPFRRLSMSPGFVSQQTQLTVFSHSQDSSTSSYQSTSSFQSTSSAFSQNQFQTYSGF